MQPHEAPSCAHLAAFPGLHGFARSTARRASSPDRGLTLAAIIEIHLRPARAATVEWQGKAVTVHLSREALDDLGRFREARPNADYLKVFEKYRGGILDDVARALAAGKATEKGLRLTGADILALQ
ncbi:hypothetical protein [Bradyrhizobium sp. CCBAU 51753]|uniref:hypothetical protein n=1 Tax=Bradyrhizobium sp. CCBAU 51753 TaxID=1325100 RepID=UPI00188B1AE3|nr:hypothetical protein [Bradyrhizobium sp. CCBAU 51753]